MRADAAPALHVDSNAQLSHAVKARRRQLRMKLNSIDSEEGDENVRKEINHRVEQDARDAYESFKEPGQARGGDVRHPIARSVVWYYRGSPRRRTSSSARSSRPRRR